MHPTRVFISHTWNNDALYWELVELLDGIFDKNWDNLSIPRNKGLEAFSSDERASFQEHELQRELYHKLVNSFTGKKEELERELSLKQEEAQRNVKEKGHALERLGIVQGKAAELYGTKWQIERPYHLEGRIASTEARVAELIANKAGEVQIKSEQIWLSDLRVQLKNRDLDQLMLRVQEIEKQILTMEASTQEVQTAVEAIQMKQEAVDRACQDVSQAVLELTRKIKFHGEALNERDHSNGDFIEIEPLGVTIKGKSSLPRNYPTLSLLIYERITSADLVVLIAGTYDQYRSWMDFEFAVSADLHKPVIAIKPPQQEQVPVELRYFVGDRSANWDPAEVRDAIYSALPGLAQQLE